MRQLINSKFAPQRHVNRFLCLALFGCLLFSACESGGENGDGTNTATTDSSTTSPATPVSAKTFKNLPYNIQDTANPQQMLDIHLPENVSAPRPCLVYFHQGGWAVDSKDDPLIPEIAYLLQHQYIIANCNYRLTGAVDTSNTATFPDQIHDCKAAIRFLKANAATYHIDSSRIVVCGQSSGGYLATMLGTTGGVASLEDKSMGAPDVSSRVRAVIDYFGPTDFMLLDNYPNIPLDSCKTTEPILVPDFLKTHIDAPSFESAFMGCETLRDCDPAKIAAANPLGYISPDDPPFLIYHGLQDCVIPDSASMALHQTLSAANVASELVLVPHAGHIDSVRYSTPAYKEKVLNFLGGL
ncbi:MAG: alpha/beta hydrolase [Bacteroidota bacterium]